jgi:2,4-dienoyl-CoA reductase (NADPH2)
MHGHEFLENGYGLKEAARIAAVLEKAGVDAIDVTAAGHRTKLPQITRQRPAGSFAYIAANIVDSVKIPVFFGGRIRTPADAGYILEQTGVAAVTVGRGLIADPQWVQKIDGTYPPAVECTACCHCLDLAFGNKPVHCALHPAESSGEGSLPISRVNSKNSRVLVAGSGPAGLAAAFEFASAGFDVTVHEQKSEIGGRPGQVTGLSGHGDLSGALDGFVGRLENLGVRILTDTPVTPESAKQFKPDILVIAAGAVPARADIPGILTHSTVLHVQDILEGAKVSGKNIAVAGGNGAGVAMALHLARAGFADMETLGYLLRYGNEQWAEEALNFKPARSVTVLKRRGFAGKGLGRSARWALMQEMELFVITLLDRIIYKEITPSGINVFNGRTKEQQFIPADTIVLATGYKSNPDIINSFKGCAEVVVAAGDVVEVGNIKSAVASAYNSFTSI